MTKHGSFKRAVRERAAASGQRYTEALAEFEGRGLEGRIFHRVDEARVQAHIESTYGVDVARVSLAGQHAKNVFRITRPGAPSWIARVFPAARPMGRVRGDAAIVGFLASRGYPAERLAVDAPVSEFDRQGVILTELVPGGPLPGGSPTIGVLADLIGRLHALPSEPAVDRDGGAFGHDTAREGRPLQDRAAAMTFLNVIDESVAAGSRELYDSLVSRILAADDGEGLPDGLLHSDVVPEHVIAGPDGPTLIHWQGSGRGPRVVELAFLLWQAENLADVETIITAYRQHVELTSEELERLPAVFMLRPLYLTAWYFWQSVSAGSQPTGAEGWWAMADEAIAADVAGAARKANLSRVP